MVGDIPYPKNVSETQPGEDSISDVIRRCGDTRQADALLPGRFAFRHFQCRPAEDVDYRSAIDDA